PPGCRRAGAAGPTPCGTGSVTRAGARRTGAARPIPTIRACGGSARSRPGRTSQSPPRQPSRVGRAAVSSVERAGRLGARRLYASHAAAVPTPRGRSGAVLAPDSEDGLADAMAEERVDSHGDGDENAVPEANLAEGRGRLSEQEPVGQGREEA